MKLKILGSSSSGNCYILENDTEALIIEAGINFTEVKKALNFNISKVVGCIITHEHKDHCKAVKDVTRAGINVYASLGTLEAIGTKLEKEKNKGVYFQIKGKGPEPSVTEKYHRFKAIKHGLTFNVGGFTIKGFNAMHDCSEPFNFLIEHKETGRFAFLTDTYYCAHTFPGLNNLLIEANYSGEILQRRLESGEEPAFLRDRVLESHMSLQTCKEFLLANDLTTVNQIILIHLSDRNSNATEFKTEIEGLTGKPVTVAVKGLEIDFNKNPF